MATFRNGKPIEQEELGRCDGPDYGQREHEAIKRHHDRRSFRQQPGSDGSVQRCKMGQRVQKFRLK